MTSENKHLSKGYPQSRGRLSVTTDFEVVDEIVFALQFAELKVPLDTSTLAKKILEIAHQKRITAGRRPASLAAAALYIACRINANNISQKEIADAWDLSEVTIRAVYKLLMTHLGIAFREYDNTPKQIDLRSARLQKIRQIIENCTQKKNEQESDPNGDANLIEIYAKVIRDLTTERDSILPEMKTLGTLSTRSGLNNWKCPHCENHADQESKECPDCGWHPMPSCVEAYKTP